MPGVDDYIAESEEYGDDISEMIPASLESQLNSLIDEATGEQDQQQEQA